MFAGDQLVEEEKTIENLVTTLRDQIKYVHVFIIAFKQTDNRMTNSLRSMISLFEKMFGKQFWNNAILEATHWNHGEEAERIRMQVNWQKNLGTRENYLISIFMFRRGRRSRSSSECPRLIGSCIRSTS